MEALAFAGKAADIVSTGRYARNTTPLPWVGCFLRRARSANSRLVQGGLSNCILPTRIPLALVGYSFVLPAFHI